MPRRTRLRPVLARLRPRHRGQPSDALAAVTLGGFATLATLTAIGVLAHLDQWSASHVMTQLHPTRASASAHQVAVQHLTVIWVRPASVSLFVVVLAACMVALALQQRFAQVGIVLAGCAGATGIGFVSRWIVTRPVVEAHVANITVRATGLTDSFPSGHALRASLLVWVVLTVTTGMRRGSAVLTGLLGAVLVAWLAGVAALLVVAGWHTPTDIVGALLVAVGAAAAAPRAVRAAGSLLTGASQQPADALS